MWTAIWIVLIMASIITPIFLIYKLIVKGMNFIKVFDVQNNTYREPYKKPENRKIGVLINSNEKNQARIQRIEIKTLRLDRKYKRLERVTEKWRRYGLIND